MSSKIALALLTSVAVAATCISSGASAGHGEGGGGGHGGGGEGGGHGGGGGGGFHGGGGGGFHVGGGGGGGFHAFAAHTGGSFHTFAAHPSGFGGFASRGFSHSFAGHYTGGHTFTRHAFVGRSFTPHSNARLLASHGLTGTHTGLATPSLAAHSQFNASRHLSTQGQFAVGHVAALGFHGLHNFNRAGFNRPSATIGAAASGERDGITGAAAGAVGPDRFSGHTFVVTFSRSPSGLTITTIRSGHTARISFWLASSHPDLMADPTMAMSLPPGARREVRLPFITAPTGPAAKQSRTP